MTCLSLNALALRQARRDRQLVSKRLLLNEDEEQPDVSMDTAPGGHVSIRYCVGSGVSNTRISQVSEFANLAHLKAGRCKGGNQLMFSEVLHLLLLIKTSHVAIHAKLKELTNR